MATAVSAYNFPKFIAVCSEIVEGQKVETNLKELIEKFLYVASLLENDDKRKGTISCESFLYLVQYLVQYLYSHTLGFS